MSEDKITVEQWAAKVDLEQAKRAHAEIGKALDSLGFTPPEAIQVHMVRVTGAMDEMAIALGLLRGPEHPDGPQ